MNRIRHWASVAAAIAGLAAVAACSSSTSDDDSSTSTIKVLGYPNQVQDILLTVARDEGFFEQGDIAVTTADYPTSLEANQAMKATKSDVLQMTAGSLMSGWQNKGDLKYFCGLMPSIPNEIMAAPGTDLPSMADGASWEEVLKSLAGKKVGFPQPEGTGWWKVYVAAMGEAGVVEKDVVTVNVGTSTSTIQQLLNSGQLDAAVVSSTGTQVLKESGKAVTLMPFQEGPPVYTEMFGAGYAAPAAELKKRPKEFAAFCKGIKEALAYVQDGANAEEAATGLSKLQGVPPKAAKAVISEVYPMFKVELPADRIQKTIDFYAEAGVIEPSPLPSVDDLVVDLSK